MPAHCSNRYHDHRRDLRKTIDYLPLPVDAHSLALIVRSPDVSFDDAVRFIAEFEAIVARHATMDTLQQAITRVTAEVGEQ